ncbi:late lactation protein B-like [Vombatus ursinus]|uniref:Lipocalin/cytosolic fatty-acid binding domain-containing protein n=1 Tax=Vombatus ursinus TaxID=29139 RepID=A0A4X2K579_VOMUR|nr:late lactation protein B-like [Vombatus ursinus]
MKVFFLTIALSLSSILQAEESSPSEERFEGTYIVKAIVTDSEDFEKHVPKEMSPLIITRLSYDALEAKIIMNKNGMCEEIKLKLEKTNNPGLFSVDEGNHWVLIEKTSVRDHWLLLCEGEINGHQIRVAKLVGPDAEENSKALEDYKKFVRLSGFNEDRIKIPGQVEACTPEHD